MLVQLVREDGKLFQISIIFYWSKCPFKFGFENLVGRSHVKYHLSAKFLKVFGI